MIGDWNSSFSFSCLEETFFFKLIDFSGCIGDLALLFKLAVVADVVVPKFLGDFKLFVTKDRGAPLAY